MQQEKSKNPFESITKLWRVEFSTKFKHISLLDLIFEDTAAATSSYEISSNSIEPEADDLWRYIGYFPKSLDEESITSKLKNYLIGEIIIAEEKEHDWVSQVQKQAKAVKAGIFYVANSNLIANCPQNFIPVKVDAGRAFGTGEHATTKGCLEMLNQIKNFSFPEKILDVGTGTGVLAIACKKLWQASEILATDIDEIAIEVAAENAALNFVEIKFALEYNMEENFRKFDLIISNILAKPLAEMSSDFAKMLKSTGSIILSGFKTNQVAVLLESYFNYGLKLHTTITNEDWCTILLKQSNR